MAMSAFALDAVSGAPEYTGKMLRGALSALLGPPPSGRPLGAISAVRPGTPTTTVSVAGSTVTVAPHSGVLDVQADATTGPYLYAVTAAETVTLNAAHATYARWDRISVQLSDPAAGDGTSTPGVAIVYTPGTPAASPALPAAPARSLTLARVVVPQSGGGAASVVWLAPEMHQGARWYASEAARDVALPAPPAGIVAVIGTGSAMTVTVWDGTAWRTVYGNAGWQPYTPTWSNLTVGNGTVTAWYVRIGNTVHYRVRLVWGSGTTASGLFYPSLPVAPLDPLGSPSIVTFFDTSAAAWQIGAYALNNYILAGSVGRASATVPWTWAAGDSVTITGTYEAS